MSWSESVIHLVIDILSKSLGKINKASEDDDMNHCVDLVSESGITIAVRLRKQHNIEFRNVLTIRTKVQSGKKTEIDKLRSGIFSKIYFSGIVSADSSKLLSYKLIDGKKLASLVSNLELHDVITNDDGTAMTEIDLNHYGSEIVLFSFEDKQAISEIEKKIKNRMLLMIKR